MSASARSTFLSPQAASPSRRQALKWMGAGVAAGSGLLAPAVRAEVAFKVGVVSALSGPLSDFASTETHVMESMRQLSSKGISLAGGGKAAVEFVRKDTRSSIAQATQLTRELIEKDKVDIVLASATMLTVNPVANVCEALGTPCITTGSPWQSAFFGRGGDPKTGFKWTNHFSFDNDDVAVQIARIWEKVDNKGAAVGLWAPNIDGISVSNSKTGLGAQPSMKNISMMNLQLPPESMTTYAPLVTLFKKDGVNFVTGSMNPRDFAQFWQECRMQGFAPKCVSMLRGTSSRSEVRLLGSRTVGMVTLGSWLASYPYVSTMTGQSSGEVGATFINARGEDWTQMLGFNHAQFELALAALTKAGTNDKQKIVQALRDAPSRTVVGTVDFRNGPVPSVSKTNLVALQWQRVGRFESLLVIDNSMATNIPVTGAFQPIA